MRIWGRGAAVLAAVVGLVPAAGPALAAQPNTWTSAASMTNGRFLHAAAPLGFEVLVAGGASSLPAAISKTAEVYNPATNAWSQIADMSTPRMQAAAVPVPRQRVLVVGGNSTGLPSSALDTAEVYDPTFNTWTPAVNPMSSPRGSFPTATLLRNDSVLVAGGQDATGTSVGTADIYSPIANKFTFTGSMGTARSAATATLLANGSVLVAGGADANNNALATGEIYNPASGRWTPVSNSMSSPRILGAATALPGGKVLIAGGETVFGSGTTRTTDIYDPTTNSFAPGPSMAVPRALFALTTLGPGGEAAAVGGLNISGFGQRNLVTSVQIYDPGAGTWSTAASLPAPLGGFTASVLGNGQLLVAGGSLDLTNGQTSSYLFTPPAAAGATPPRAGPRLRLSGVPRRMTLKRFLRGLTFSITPNRPASLQISLLAMVRRATIARAFNLTLVRKTLGRSSRKRTVRLVPPKRLVGKPGRATVRLVIVATDAARARSTTTRTIGVRR